MRASSSGGRVACVPSKVHPLNVNCLSCWAKGHSNMNTSLYRQLFAVLLVVMTSGCSSPVATDRSHGQTASKIKFSLDDIRADGLRGPSDGLISVSYEFCVPKDESIYQEIRRIDPSIEIHKNSEGRIGCTKQQALCIGHTHQPDWRAKLMALTSQPYISEIRQCFFE